MGGPLCAKNSGCFRVGLKTSVEGNPCLLDMRGIVRSRPLDCRNVQDMEPTPQI